MTLRMAVWAGSLSFLLVHGVGCTPPAGDEAAVAKAEIKGKAGTILTGTATFTAGDAGTKVVIELTGAPAGELGVHVHETGDCSAADFTSSGGHFNPATSASSSSSPSSRSSRTPSPPFPWVGARAAATSTPRARATTR